MYVRIFAFLSCFPFLAQAAGQVDKGAQAKAAADLRARIEATPTLPFDGVRFTVHGSAAGSKPGLVSWLAVDGTGTIYELQRGEEGDPVLALDREGKVLRSWGKGEYKIPHSIRIDPSGNVWTVDAGSSIVVKYSPLGEKLMTITVDEQPETGSAFNGTTDIAFAPNGHPGALVQGEVILYSARLLYGTQLSIGSGSTPASKGSLSDRRNWKPYRPRLVGLCRLIRLAAK